MTFQEGANRAARVIELILGCAEIALAVRFAIRATADPQYLAFSLFFVVLLAGHGVALLLSARWALWLAVALLLVANFFSIFYYGMFGGGLAGLSQREALFFLGTLLNGGACFLLLRKANAAKSTL